MKLISTQTLGTAAASIEFTSIPQTFTDLLILSSCRITTGGASTSLLLTFNSQTANRSSRNLVGLTDSGTAISGTSTAMRGGRANNSGATANTFSNSSLYIPNYAGSTQKSASVDGTSENNGAEGYLDIVANLWADTAAITSIQLAANSENLVAGSTISLYGILKGSDGIVTTS